MNVTHKKCLWNKTRWVTEAVSGTTPKAYMKLLLLNSMVMTVCKRRVSEVMIHLEIVTSIKVDWIENRLVLIRSFTFDIAIS